MIILNYYFITSFLKDKLVNRIEKKELSDQIILPQNLNASLRSYQKKGYEWLKVIDKYQFGGILADDMGLRKNIATTCCNIRLCAK